MYQVNNKTICDRIQHERINPPHVPVTVKNNAKYHEMRIALEMERLAATGKDPLTLNAGIADKILLKKAR